MITTRGNKLAILATAIGLTACGVPEPKTERTVENTGDQSSFNQEEESESENDVNPGELPEGLAQNLVGTWVGSCIDDVEYKYAFSETQWVQAFDYYEEGSDCRSGLITRTLIGGNFEVVDVSEDGLVSWNGRVSSYQRTFYIQELIDVVNEKQLHGYSDWEVGEAKECINLATEEGGSIVRPQTIYSILEISEDGQLAFGRNAKTPETRATTVDWQGDDGGPYLKAP